jgi:DNA-directed RNA polymerase specialized sigma24 family protein
MDEAKLQKRKSSARSCRIRQNFLEGPPEEFQAVIVMADILGLDYADAAQTLGQTIGNIKKPFVACRYAHVRSFAGLERATDGGILPEH